MKESIKVFKTRKDKMLYKLLHKARNNTVKYGPILEKLHEKKYKNIMNQHYFEYVNKDAIKTAIDGAHIMAYILYLWRDFLIIVKKFIFLNLVMILLNYRKC